MFELQYPWFCCHGDVLMKYKMVECVPRSHEGGTHGEPGNERTAVRLLWDDRPSFNPFSFLLHGSRSAKDTARRNGYPVERPSAHKESPYGTADNGHSIWSLPTVARAQSV